jgi:hypothetical protein
MGMGIEDLAESSGLFASYKRGLRTLCSLNGCDNAHFQVAKCYLIICSKFLGKSDGEEKMLSRYD